MRIYFLISGILILGLATSGMGVVSEMRDPQILPGSPVYNAKLFLENFAISLAPSPAQKVDLSLKLANERLSEATKLVDAGESWRMPDSFQPMRSLLLQASDFANSPSATTEQISLDQKVSAAVIMIQSKLYDLKARTPDPNQDALALNIAVSDRLAEANIARSHFLSVSTLGHGNLAQADQSAVLGASDAKMDYSPWIGLAAILLIPVAVFLPHLMRRSKRHPKS